MNARKTHCVYCYNLLADNTSNARKHLRTHQTHGHKPATSKSMAKKQTFRQSRGNRFEAPTSGLTTTVPASAVSYHATPSVSSLKPQQLWYNPATSSSIESRVTTLEKEVLYLKKSLVLQQEEIGALKRILSLRQIPAQPYEDKGVELDIIETPATVLEENHGYKKIKVNINMVLTTDVDYTEYGYDEISTKKVAMKPSSQAVDIGLFSEELIMKNDFIIEAKGKITKTPTENSKYVFTLYHEIKLDATHYGNESRFINSSKLTLKPANVKLETLNFPQEGLKLFVKATKVIRKGDEILLDYAVPDFMSNPTGSLLA